MENPPNRLFASLWPWPWLITHDVHMWCLFCHVQQNPMPTQAKIWMTRVTLTFDLLMVHDTSSLFGSRHDKMCHILAVLSWLNDLKAISQGQRSLCATHPLMLVIICAQYRKNPSRTVHAVERIRQDVPYFSSFIAKSWLNNLKDTGQGQRLLCTTHPLILVIIHPEV